MYACIGPALVGSATARSSFSVRAHTSPAQSFDRLKAAGFVLWGFGFGVGLDIKQIVGDTFSNLCVRFLMLLWLSSGFLGCEPGLVSGGEFGVVDETAFEFGDSCC